MHLSHAKYELLSRHLLKLINGFSQLPVCEASISICSNFFRPNGRLDIIVDVPDEPMAWILGGFAISKDLGFGIIHDPVRVSVVR